MFGDFNQNDWQGWTPPWMQQGEEGQGPQGQHAHHGHHHEHHHGPRGQFGPEWQGPRGPFGGGWRGPFGFRGPRGPFGPGFGFRGPFGGGWQGWQGPQGQFGPGWQGPSPEMQALRSEAFEVARLFAIAGRTALDNKDRQLQLHAMLERTRKELTDMIYSGTEQSGTNQAQSASNEPGVEQA